MDDAPGYHDEDPKGRQEPLRSPIRPVRPDEPAPAPDPPPPDRAGPQPVTSPLKALGALRQKMEQIADEFSAGKLNRAQFYALYKRYSEQRTIIERLVERNPQTDAWKQVMGAPGQTGFLRTHFAATVLFFAVYRNGDRRPLYSDGREQPDYALFESVLIPLWKLTTRPKLGLGRKRIGEEKWMILGIGQFGATVVVWSTEPSISQARLVRDLHADFERANQAALQRGLITPDKLVFPQRALMDQSR
ncbi:MAG: hypothetical protein IPK19_09165 [Chloroflexi bacterium]|nr:hypothetical protein [Chloroflexota bacterium]